MKVHLNKLLFLFVYFSSTFLFGSDSKQATKFNRNYNIHEAAKNGDFEGVSLAYNATPNLLSAPSALGITPLGLSCTAHSLYGRKEVQGQKPLNPENYRQSSLFEKLVINQAHVTKFLLEKGADLELESLDPSHLSPIHRACLFDMHLSLDQLLQAAQKRKQLVEALTHKSATHLPKVLAEKAPLELVFNNLSSNSIHVLAKHLKKVHKNSLPKEFHSITDRICQGQAEEKAEAEANPFKKPGKKKRIVRKTQEKNVNAPPQKKRTDGGE